MSLIVHPLPSTVHILITPLPEHWKIWASDSLDFSQHSTEWRKEPLSDVELRQRETKGRSQSQMPQCWALQHWDFLSPLNGNQKPRRRKKKKKMPWGAIIQNDTEENSKSQHSLGYTAEVRTAERCLPSEGQPAASAFLNLHSPLSVRLKKEQILSGCFFSTDRVAL